MTPQVSLVMPAWRPHAPWLLEAVRSALDDAAVLELLVVDDGSEEPVADLLREVDDPRLRVLRVAHGGPYAARNAGLAAAAGAYVRFVDSDDVVEPGSTSRLLELAGGREDVLAYGATLMCDEHLEPQGVVTSTLDGDAAEECVAGGFDVYVVSILFPRAVLERSGGWEERSFRVSGDWDFVLRALEHGSVRPVGAVVTRYRRHAGSVTGLADVAAGAEAAQLVLDRYFARHPEQRGSALARRAYAAVYLDRAEAFAWRGDRRRAARMLRRAARLAPGRTAHALAGLLLRRAAALSPPVARRALRPRRRRG